jgi:hypothetical protein
MVNIKSDLVDSLVANSIKGENKINSYYSLLLLILFLSFISCSKSNNNSAKKPIVQQDTIVGIQELTTKITSSNYLHKSVRFFLLINNDTSDFSCLINKNREDGTYSMNLSFYGVHSSYDERLKELETILPVINERYSLDSLKSIYMGRLIYYGDLAISVTKAYHEHYDSGKKSENDEAISSFLMKTRLANDFDKLLKPYAISLKQISSEKIFFADKTELLTLSKVTNKADSIPEKILDCMIWLKIDK